MREGWTYKRLEEVATIKSGYTPSSDDLSDVGVVPYFKVGDMNMVGNEKYLQYSLSFVDDTFKTFPHNSIAFPKNGAAIATNKKRILKQSSVVDLNTAVLIPIKNENVEYLYYWICKIDFREITRRGAVPTLDIKTLMQLEVPYPPLSEQQRIVSELDLLSSIIDKKKAQLKEYDQLAQSIFYDMFGDPITNEKGWEVKKLMEVCKEIGDGLHGTPQYDPNGNVAFINGNNLIDGRICITERTQFVNEIEAQKIYIELDSKTILLSINGTLGKTAIYNNEKIVLGKSACYLRLTNRLNVHFVLSLMNTNTFKNFLEDNSSKSTIKNVGLKAIRNFMIILPPIEAQQQFADKIKEIEKQKELIKQSIIETETLFNSRMDYYFN